MLPCLLASPAVHHSRLKVRGDGGVHRGNVDCGLVGLVTGESLGGCRWHGLESGNNYLLQLGPPLELGDRLGLFSAELAFMELPPKPLGGQEGDDSYHHNFQNCKSTDLQALAVRIVLPRRVDDANIRLRLRVFLDWFALAIFAGRSTHLGLQGEGAGGET